MEKVPLFLPFYTQSFNRPRVLKTFFVFIIDSKKIFNIYFGDIWTLKFCTLDTSWDILSHLWNLNMRKGCYKTCFPRSCKKVKEQSSFNFFNYIYGITRLSTSHQQANCFQLENCKLNWQNVILNKTNIIYFIS